MPVSLLSEVMSSPECNYETLRQGENTQLLNVLGMQGREMWVCSQLPIPRLLMQMIRTHWDLMQLCMELFQRCPQISGSIYWLQWASLLTIKMVITAVRFKAVRDFGYPQDTKQKTEPPDVTFQLAASKREKKLRTRSGHMLQMCVWIYTHTSQHLFCICSR